MLAAELHSGRSAQRATMSEKRGESPEIFVVESSLLDQLWSL